MTSYSVRPEDTQAAIAQALGDKVKRISVDLGEVKVLVSAQDYHAAALLLRDTVGCQFEQMMDLCAVDYSTYGDGRYEGLR